MTTAQDTTAEASRRNMENFLDAMTFWPSLFQKAANTMPTLDARTLEAKASSMDELIDSLYEVPMQLAIAQRDVLKSYMAVGRSFTSHMMASAQSVAKTTAAKRDETVSSVK